MFQGRFGFSATRLKLIARKKEGTSDEALGFSMKAPGSGEVERHVVLVAPEIHWNTGNIGRTCLGAGAILHLVEPLGFSLSDRYLKRAGLDYWNDVRVKVWKNFDDFLGGACPRTEEIVLFSKKGNRPFWDLPVSERLFLIFGSETRGLPDTVLNRYPDAAYYIPISSKIRSLNLSTAVGIALYESLRHTGDFHCWS